MNQWIFGYGSLIWRPDIEYLERHPARLPGWQRRFWQGSHDHRGTPDAPGRVVTLISSPGAVCHGMAYLVDHEVFEHLDHREKNGYERHPVRIAMDKTQQSVDGLTYVAAIDNHAYLGPAPLADMVKQIRSCTGPSGRNVDYLLELADALRALRADDPHVFELETAVKALNR